MPLKKMRARALCAEVHQVTERASSQSRTPSASGISPRQCGLPATRCSHCASYTLGWYRVNRKPHCRRRCMSACVGEDEGVLSSVRQRNSSQDSITMRRFCCRQIYNRIASHAQAVGLQGVQDLDSRGSYVARYQGQE